MLAQLNPEFPDLTPSKLRFLEEQGLIFPARTASGYRKFSGNDLERLRVVLKLQRDNYMPLKIIKRYLDDLEAGKHPTLPISAIANPAPPYLGGMKLSRADLIARTGVSPALLQEAISFSLIPAAELYDEETVTILQSLAELQKSGIEPRHLRGYRAAVEREVGLIESSLTSLANRKDVSSRAKADERGKELALLLETIRSTMTRSQLGRK